MTMQTTTLPFQVSGANALSQQPKRNAAAGVQAPETDFGATLSREIAQRQAAPGVTAAPAPSVQRNRPAPGAQGKPHAADKPAAQGPKAAAREPARQNEAAADAPAQAGAASTESADGAEDAAESASVADAGNPIADMLAFMANLAQPAQARPAATVATEAPAAADGAGLKPAALQSAFAKLDGADAAATDAGLASATEGKTGAGFVLDAGVQPAADATADLHPLQQNVQAAASAEAAPATVQLQAQAAKFDALNPAAAPSDRIPARVGTQAWDNQVSQRIVYMVGKEQAATLTLNPPDLGPVQIVLNVSNDQASVAFSSSQLEVRQALENALPRLREMMGENGIALGNATVDAGGPDQRQAQQDGAHRGHGGHGRDPGVDHGNPAANEHARPLTRTVAVGERGAVDIFA